MGKAKEDVNEQGEAEDVAEDAERSASKEIAPEQLVKYDLTHKMTPYLDRHLIFPIFQFLGEIGTYKKEDIMRAEIALLSETNMIDFAMDKYETIGEEPPAALELRRDQVIEKLSTQRDRVLKLLELLENDEEVQKMKTIKSIAEICTVFELEEDVFDGLMNYAKLQFDCGNYSLCGDLLKHYRSIMSQDAERPMTWRLSSSWWGSLASKILQGEFEEGAEDIYKLDDLLENTKMTKREVLLQRTWLLHWALFCIFQDSGSVPGKLLDQFLNEKSMSIISLACPHLFRYVSACLILNKRVKHLMRETVWIISNERETYNDPITRFLLALFDTYDFDEAQLELKECEKVCKADFFLSKCWADFEENARLLIFETYCRIHQCINIEMIASKLNMEAEEAELWIVKLIQNAKLDARIDSEKSRVVMTKGYPTVYQQVLEKTKNLSFRSTMMLSNLEKRDASAKENEKVESTRAGR